jgi:hypothetical protein
MADKTFYRVGDGLFDAHGRAVDSSGTLLDPSGHAGNLSAQEAEGVKEAEAPAPAPEPKAAAKPAAKKAAKKK